MYRSSGHTHDGKKNQHELDHEHVLAAVPIITKALPMTGKPLNIVLMYAASFVMGHDPYWPDIVAAVETDQPIPTITLTPPIPYTTTTAANIKWVGETQSTQEAHQFIIDNARAECNIDAIGNSKGFIVQPCRPDPRDISPGDTVLGRPAQLKTRRMFGTASTTFWVTTPLREPGKRFALKMFQNNGFMEALGGLKTDLSDIRDINITVFNEMRRIYGDAIQFTDFRATMRNYKLQVCDGYHIIISALSGVFKKLSETTHPHIHCSSHNLIRIKLKDHTSKKQEVVIKIFQSKINIDSCVYEHHIHDIYKFLCELIDEHRDIVLYMPVMSHRKNSEDYYLEAGVDVPPLETRL